MVRNYSVRTDLALEEKERFESDNVEISGVILEEDYDEEKEIRVTRVQIETENGAKAMGKPVGTYLTLETPNLAVPDDEEHMEIAGELCRHLRELIEKNERRAGEDLSVLVVRGIVNETHPDLVIAVDALAARNSKRLNRTVQIADTGINPGSGVGNHRCGMTEESLGVPVIGIGVPTVVDAATIVNDTMENFIKALESSESLKGVGEVLRSYNAGEKYEFVRELISPHLNGMFVTPKDVDEMVHHISHTISEALNMLFVSRGEG